MILFSSLPDVRSHQLTMFISPEQEVLISHVFETYLTEHHHGDILQLIADTNEDAHHSIFVNAMTLFEASMEVMPQQSFKTSVDPACKVVTNVKYCNF